MRRVRRACGWNACVFPQTTTTDAFLVEPLLDLSRFFNIGAPTSVSHRNRNKLTLSLGNGGIVIDVRLPAPSREIYQLMPKATLLGLTLAEGSPCSLLVGSSQLAVKLPTKLPVLTL